MEAITRDQGALKENVNIIFFFNYFGRTSGEFEQQTFSLVFLLSEDSQQNCATQRFSFPQNCSER